MSKATFFVYTAFNSKTDKVNLVVVNGVGKSQQFIKENCQGRYLISVLEQIETVVIDGIRGLHEKKGITAVEVTFRRFRDNNLGDCLDRINRTLEQLSLVDNRQEELLEGALKRHNGSKIGSYEVMKRIIVKLYNLRQEGVQVTITHESTAVNGRKANPTNDVFSDLAWRSIK